MSDYPIIDLRRSSLRKQAASQAAQSVAGAAGVIAQPVGGALVKAILELLKGIFSQGKVDEVDAQFISDVIREGADSGVEELRIKVDRDQIIGADGKFFDPNKTKAGRKFSANIGVGGETTYYIHVKYKK